MTKEEREEAIRNIKEHCYFASLNSKAKEALDMAIEALNQELCDKYMKEIEHLRKYISKLETQIVEQEPCEDAISRQAVIDGIKRYFHDKYYQRTSIQDCRDCLIEDVIKPLLPVTPQPKMGHWINGDEKCPCCGKSKFEGLDADIYADWRPKHCPNCGTRMEVEK